MGLWAMCRGDRCLSTLSLSAALKVQLGPCERGYGFLALRQSGKGFALCSVVAVRNSLITDCLSGGGGDQGMLGCWKMLLWLLLEGKYISVCSSGRNCLESPFTKL